MLPPDSSKHSNKENFPAKRGLRAARRDNRVIGRHFTVAASSPTLDAELKDGANGKGTVDVKPIGPKPAAKLRKLTAPRNRCQAGTVAQRARPLCSVQWGRNIDAKHHVLH
jgi:hypothetical protein